MGIIYNYMIESLNLKRIFSKCLINTLARRTLQISIYMEFTHLCQIMK